MILGGEALVREARTFKIILNSYTRGTRQAINLDKSSVFFLNTPLERQRKIARIMGYGIRTLPVTYLGLPLSSKPLDSFWSSIIDNFNNKLAGWKGATLSQAGKCTLVTSILQNLPTYAHSLFRIPAKFVDRMERIQRDFLWTRTDDQKRYHLVAWD